MNAHPTQIGVSGGAVVWSGCNGGRVGTCCPRVGVLGLPETRGHKCPPYVNWYFRLPERGLFFGETGGVFGNGLA